ncbi:MAG: hypothetical protein ACREV9_13550 [Burkholderiales bacterium]
MAEAPALSSGELRTLFRASQRALVENRPISSLHSGAGLSKAELAAINEVGLASKPWRKPQTADPLAQSIVSYMALIETSFATGKVAEMLKVDVSRIRQRLRERSLVGFEHEGEWRLPRFQFEDSKTLPGLAEVVKALPADLNPLDVAEWFMTSSPDLEDEKSDSMLSPRDWLLSGHALEPVLHLARHL